MRSFKKELIQNFQFIPQLEGFEKNKLIIYTAAGIFIGTPVDKKNKENNDVIKITSSFIDKFLENYKNTNGIPDESPLDDNDGCFTLSDVVLIRDTTRMNIPIAVIFFDQVIGISFGDAD